jgi:hypothetical protein
MRIIAAPGHRVPTEEDPYKYITETEAVDVPDTSYYRRRVATGELLAAEKTRGSAKQPAQESAQ